MIKRLLTYLLIFAQLNLTFHHAYAHNILREEDGDCALHCLGLSRGEAIRLLKDHGRRDAAIRKLVRPDLNNRIQESAQQGVDFFAAFPSLSARKQALEDQRHSKLLALTRLRDQISARLIRENKGRILDHDMAVYLNHAHVTTAEKTEMRRLSQDHDVAEQAVLLGFYESPEVYEAFIDTVYGRGEWFAYVPNATSALDALCQIKGINLVVKRKDARGALKTVHRRHVNNQGPTHTLLHTMSGSRGGFYNPRDPQGEHLNHFNRLLTPDEKPGRLHEKFLVRISAGFEDQIKLYKFLKARDSAVFNFLMQTPWMRNNRRKGTAFSEV